MALALYFLAAWLGGGILIGVPLGLALGWVSRRLGWPVRPSVVLGQALAVGAITGLWWARGPELHPVWLAVLLFLAALFSVNGTAFARYVRSFGAAIDEIWQVLPGAASAWIIHQLLR